MSDQQLAAPAHTGQRAAPAPGRLRVAAARTALEVRIYFRERDSVVFSFLFPILMLGLFAIVFGGDEGVFAETDGGGVEVAQYFLPGMVAAGIMLVSFQTPAIGIAIERDEGTLKRLRGTPLPPVSYFLGKVGMILVVGIAQIALLLAVAAIVFGVPLPTDAADWATFAWVYVFGTAVCTVLGVAYSSLPSSAKSAGAVVVGPMLILQFISGVFFVFNDLPGWLRDVAAVFPLKWLAQGMRSVFLPDHFEHLEVSGSWQHGPAALILSLWMVVGLLLCLRTFRWRRRGDG